MLGFGGAPQALRTSSSMLVFCAAAWLALASSLAKASLAGGVPGFGSSVVCGWFASAGALASAACTASKLLVAASSLSGRPAALRNAFPPMAIAPPWPKPSSDSSITCAGSTSPYAYFWPTASDTPSPAISAPTTAPPRAALRPTVLRAAFAASRRASAVLASAALTVPSFTAFASARASLVMPRPVRPAAPIVSTLSTASVPAVPTALRVAASSISGRFLATKPRAASWSCRSTPCSRAFSCVCSSKAPPFSSP